MADVSESVRSLLDKVTPAAGFAPREGATVVYLVDGIGRYEEQLKQLGPHTSGVGRLYIKDLEKS